MGENVFGNALEDTNWLNLQGGSTHRIVSNMALIVSWAVSWDSYLQEAVGEIAFVRRCRHGQFIAVADARGLCTWRSLGLIRERHNSHLQQRNIVAEGLNI